MQHLLQSIRDWWHGVARDARRPQAPQDVIVHDPDAARPHDLDDPFLDPAVQSRIGGVIASKAAKNP
jgi:hypothetical protein